MRSFWRNSWIQAALDFLFPAECVMCGKFSGDDRVLMFCRACWNTISVLEPPLCPCCGSPYSSQNVLTHAPDFRCGECRASQPHFDRAFSAALYDGVLKEAIYQFKFYQKTGLGLPLIHLLLEYLPATLHLADYGYVLPVPLHKRREQWRGYNQAAILAQHLARDSHLDYMGKNLLRVRNTHAQWPIKDRAQRRENVKNAFNLKSPERVRGQRLILIDDIFTTGATVNECARVLKQAGAHSVLVLTLARAGH